MMAYHQRVNQFKSRIDFDDPSTTKPPSLAKSAVLQALEEEERQQQSRGKGGGGAGFLLQQSRPSRSRQREPVAAAERARTPCINRDTVLRINRRPVRHRSCDSFWPPAKTAARSPSPRGQLGGAEGLKRVAWPPSAEGGDEYEQVQQQQQQQQPQQQQQQQYYQQPQAQHQPAPTYQQYQQPAHQQQQPRERIIPIQRTTSHISPQRTPKSPLGGGHQQPRYPPQQQQQPHHQRQPAGSSTVAFSGGRAVLPQQAQPQQQQYYQPAPRPVSAPYHQQVQQQNRYSSPSTASLGSPRSPQIVGGGHSPRGWAHVQSPVPVYRPAPQHHPHQQQQQNQQYVPPPFQTEPNPTAAYQRQASGGFGPRKVHY